ncbi:trehalose/maltose hydrolase-like predicted phosphorylase [Arcicella aurantiaca]|uniref:Trehalose/maltose hydrolase-like predicted phosphorylase n=1 Tax=Arcicella aurantiaca TaxID=591202 RepID=A0A316EZ99_9BACT|nr:glycoside hydrolase family 65 protein [Arcicella aurantiaca]PWK28595.1 trehalose/maltose hydrolase-like predicted phosphorylase [Arcicella aurantiaca]
MKKKLLLLLPLIVAQCSALFAQDPWLVTADKINPNNYYGVTVANGMIGIVSSPEPLKVKDVVLNGAFDTYGRGRVSNILKTFEFANMDLEVDGRRLGRADISNYKQVLDMKNAILTTTFDYSDKVAVKYSIMALRHLPYTMMIDVEVKAKKDCEITPHSVMSAPDMLRDVKNSYALIDRPHALIPLMTSVAKSPTGKHTLAASNSFVFAEERGKEPQLIHEEWDYGMHRLKFSKKMIANETYSFSVVGSTISTEQTPDPLNEAERLTIYAALEKHDRLLKRHKEGWEKLWTSDIKIEGDAEAQRAAHFALYHLYSFCREGQAYSLSPMGLSGLGYNGHVFWDTEIWMYPAILVLHPEMAKSILEYRFERMESARANAKSHGYQGVMFPWESDDKGQEATPVWALTGPFQHHITADVGWAFWKYYQVTHDKEWLKTRGYPMLKEVADFWVSRAEKGTDGKYHIINVVCADEWAENVDDNAYTNGMVKEVLDFAIEASDELKMPVNPKWEEVMNGLVILRNADGVTKEHATYNGETIKQADVNLLSYPMHQVVDKELIKKDLDYYEARMSADGPAMSQAILCILHARLNNTDKAAELFTKSYKPNEVPPFGVLAETAGGTNPYFATGAGGFLQTILNGFGGLDIEEEGIIQLKDIKLPKTWKSLTITGVGVDKKTVTVLGGK